MAAYATNCTHLTQGCEKIAPAISSEIMGEMIAIAIGMANCDVLIQ